MLLLQHEQLQATISPHLSYCVFDCRHLCQADEVCQQVSFFTSVDEWGQLTVRSDVQSEATLLISQRLSDVTA